MVWVKHISTGHHVPIRREQGHSVPKIFCDPTYVQTVCMTYNEKIRCDSTHGVGPYFWGSVTPLS